MLDARQIIERIRSYGANIVLDGRKLEIVNPAKLPEGAAAYVRQHGKEIAAFLDREAEFNERAAFLEYDGGLTRATAEYITRAAMANLPDGIDPAEWPYMVSKVHEAATRGLAA